MKIESCCRVMHNSFIVIPIIVPNKCKYTIYCYWMKTSDLPVFMPLSASCALPPHKISHNILLSLHAAATAVSHFPRKGHPIRSDAALHPTFLLYIVFWFQASFTVSKTNFVTQLDHHRVFSVLKPLYKHSADLKHFLEFNSNFYRSHIPCALLNIKNNK